MSELDLARPESTDVGPGVEYCMDEQSSEADRLRLLDFLMQEFGLRQPMVLTGAESAITTQFLADQYRRQQTPIDLLYLQADSFSGGSAGQLAELCSQLSRRGVICVESGDDDPASIGQALPADRFEAVLVSPGFAIYARIDGERPLDSMRYQIDLFRRRLHFDRKRTLKRLAARQMPEVAVIVLTYRHEGYIAECLNSVLSQRGQFRLRVIIIDDASPDDTAQVVKDIVARQRSERIDIRFRENSENLGVVANLAAGLRAAQGCDYLTFCEGDDFWSSEERIQEHIRCLQEQPDAVMSFNSMALCTADGSARRIFQDHAALKGTGFNGMQLAENNFIGNFTACFYHGEVIDVVPPAIFELYTVDWLFNLYCAQFGCIAHLKKELSVYRQHGGGEWSSRPALEKVRALLGHIGRYNRFLDFAYDAGFQQYRYKLYALLDEGQPEVAEKIDLIILDDVFPSVRSGFRYVEFTSYLREFQSSLALTSGASLPVLENTPLTEVVRNYQRQFPDQAAQLMIDGGRFPLRLGKLVYLNFLANTYARLAAIEAARVPFVFTLYPGAGFVLNNPQCDAKLKRIFDSPCFQRVVVTQQVTHDYIVDRGLCPVEKVQMIFGVVMPEIDRRRALPAKLRWGFGKPRLDICFMAHKYTTYGEDKGYDVFINVANRLRQRYDDIHFHVVGPFDARVIDVGSISDRISFYGSMNPEAFDGFFQDMDIILSPNISGKIFPGSFDGFPTASCTEAGLRGTAIFAVDEFSSAPGRFNDAEDIVLIRYDLEHILQQIERYRADPEALKAVGERGMRRILELYSLDAQMTPRIELLREVMRYPRLGPVDVRLPVPTGSAFEHLQAPGSRPRRLLSLLRRHCPEPLKRVYRTWKHRHG